MVVLNSGKPAEGAWSLCTESLNCFTAVGCALASGEIPFICWFWSTIALSAIIVTFLCQVALFFVIGNWFFSKKGLLLSFVRDFCYDNAMQKTGGGRGRVSSNLLSSLSFYETLCRTLQLNVICKFFAFKPLGRFHSHYKVCSRLNYCYHGIILLFAFMFSPPSV